MCVITQTVTMQGPAQRLSNPMLLQTHVQALLSNAHAAISWPVKPKGKDLNMGGSSTTQCKSIQHTTDTTQHNTA